MADTISFDILARDRASGSFRATSAAASELSRNLDKTALSSAAVSEALKKQGKASDLTAAQSSALARVLRLTGDDEDKLAAKALLADAAVKRLGDQMEKTAAVNVAGSGAGFLGGGQVSGIAALVAAGVALAPVIATLTVGLAGFSAAAYSVVGPVLKAAQATGGLKANMDSLTPAQRGVASGFLSLEGDFSQFSKALQPQVFSVLNDGLGIARTLLAETAPVAKSFGTALDQVLVTVGKGLQSAEWKQFFQFMATNAGPDVLLVANAIGSLVNALPPLLEALQPVATSVLGLTADLGNLVGQIASVVNAEEKFNNTASSSTGWLGKLWKAAKQAFDQLEPGAAAVSTFKSYLDKTAPSAKKTGTSIATMGNQAQTTATQITNLYNALHKLLDPLTQNITDAVTFKNDQVALSAALKTSHGWLGLHTVAQRASATAAAQAAQDALTLSNNIATSGGSASAAIRPLQSLVTQLVKAGASGRDAAALIKALRDQIALLRSKTINVSVVTSSTSLPAPGVPPGTKRRASGGSVSGLTVVGEQGWELVRTPPGSYVYNHAQSMAMLSGRSGGSSWPAPVAGGSGRGSARKVVLEFRGGQSAFDQFMLGWVRKTVQARGGGDVQVTFGRTA